MSAPKINLLTHDRKLTPYGWLLVVLLIAVVLVGAYFIVRHYNRNDGNAGENYRQADIDEPINDQAVSEPEAKAWEESEYLKGLSANEVDAIFPREAMKKRSLLEQAENQAVKDAIEKYCANRHRSIVLQDLTMRYLPAGVSGTAWYRKGDDLTSHPKRLPSGSAVWVDNDGEIVLIGGCGNFFEMTQSSQAVSKPRAKRACAKPKQPCRVTAKPPCEEMLVAPTPGEAPEEWVVPSRERNVQVAHSTPQGNMSYSAGWTIIGYGRKSAHKRIETCDPGGEPPIQPPTEWVTPCR